LGTFITTFVAILLPAVGVWYGGWLDNLIQRLTEVNMVLPGLAIVVLTNLLFGVNVWIVLGMIVLLNAFGSPIKSFRSAFLQAKEAPYIEMARSYGASDFRIITRYLVPRILPVFIPQLVTQVPSFIFLEATLGFFNINSHYPSWGRIIYDGLAHGAIYGSPFWVLEPIFLLLLTGLAFAMLGSALERILNPRIISDISAAPDKIVTPRRKIKLPVLTRRVFVSAILALLALAILVPTIQGKTLASYFLDLMDETRTLKLTTIRPSIASPHTPSPFTPTSTEITAAATPPSATPSPAFTITSTTQVSCIPANPPLTAKVLEIVDGNTIKIYMNDLVYVVRYIGVEVPQDSVNAMNAFLDNSELVFRKDVIL
ncbi:MAG TPA: ABC transporter permease, partial [Anaerolineales bacterium]|nr:ABC transporter permease [Anaerolineales bacterium]